MKGDGRKDGRSDRRSDCRTDGRKDSRRDCRLLSLPDELLLIILAFVDHPCDRCTVALSCSRFRLLSRRTPHTLSFEFNSKLAARRTAEDLTLFQLWGVSNAREWLKSFDDYSRVFTHIVDLAVVLSNHHRNLLLPCIGAGCPKLKRLRLVAAWDEFHSSSATWRKFAKQCSLLTTLELDCPMARRDYCSSPRRFHHMSNRSNTILPPVHAFPSLHSLTLLFLPTDTYYLPRCSSLTSLTLHDAQPPTLPALASPSSSVRSTLLSLTLHSTNLEGSLTLLTSFPSLSSLSLVSCRVDPFELLSLARSLHTLTHLSIHDCSSVSSHAIAALVQTNPALSSLSLCGSSYRLYSAQGFRTLLHRASPHLKSLNLSGLSSFRPGMLARCPRLKSLAVDGTRESEDGGRVCQSVSMESLLNLLVRVQQRGGGEGGGGGGITAGAAAAAGEVEAGGAEPAGEAAGASGAAVVRSVALTEDARRTYMDIHTAAAAAHDDLLASFQDILTQIRAANDAISAAFSEARWARETHRDYQLAKTRDAIAKARAAASACRSVRVAIRESDAAIEEESALMAACAAAGAGAGAGASAAGGGASAGAVAGVFVDRLSRGGAGAEEGLFHLEDIDGILPEDDSGFADVEEDEGLGGEGGMGAVGGVGSLQVAVGVLEARLREMSVQRDAMLVSFRDMRMPSCVRQPAAAAAAVDGAVAVGGAAGAAAGGAAVVSADVTAAAAVTAGPAAAAGTAAASAAASAAATASGAAGGTAGAAANGAAAATDGGAGTAAHAAAGAGSAASARAVADVDAEALQEAEATQAAEAGEKPIRRGTRGRRGRRGTRVGIRSRGARNSTTLHRQRPNQNQTLPTSDLMQGCKDAVPVEVHCPPLYSLTLENLHFTTIMEPIWVPVNLPTASPLMYLTPDVAAPVGASVCSFDAPRLVRQPQSFEAIATAAVFGRLKRLAFVWCPGLKEGVLLDLLLACTELEDLRVESCVAMSDVVLGRIRLEMLTGLSVVGCDGVSADGVGGVLASFPRLRHLKVEERKVLERARRELIRAGVVVRGN